MKTPYERELAILEAQLMADEMSLHDYNNAVRDLDREERADAQEAAEKAYHETLENY